MSYAERARNIKAAIAELKAGRDEETQKIMHDDVALVKSRVINQGKMSDGSGTGGYSEAVVPYWMHGSSVKNADFNIKAKQKEGLKKLGYFFSYKQWRELNNRPTAFKNFSFTGNMWKKIKALLVQSTDTSTTYILGSDDPDAQKLVDFNTAQTGPFLDQSEEEKELLRSLNRQRVFNVLRKHNLA